MAGATSVSGMSGCGGTDSEKGDGDEQGGQGKTFHDSLHNFDCGGRFGLS